MRDRAIVSERGTVTIPEAIRKIAQISPGDLLEFKPLGKELVVRRLIVGKGGEDLVLSDEEWEKLDHLVKRQLLHREYTTYRDLEKAKQHSRKLGKTE